MSLAEQPPRPYFRTPVVTPDGAQIAFVHATDIWLVGISGGEAERLTAHVAGHSSPRWSPDGRSLAFSSNRLGNGEVYVLPLHGGAVQRLTNYTAASTPEAWSPDGKYLYFSSGREMQGLAMYRVDRDGGTPVSWLSHPYEQLEHLALSPDGTRMAFNISRDQWWRRGPNPFGGSEVWVASNAIDAEDFRRVGGEYIGMNRWPLWAPDGQGLYVVSDRDGIENIWLLSLENGEARQITHFREGRLLWPSISADGSTIVFEREFGIWRLDPRSGDAAPLNIRVRADTKFPAVRTLTVTRDLSELVLAPDGKKIAFVAHGEVFVDFADKETDKERRQGASFRVTNTPFREADVTWAPDSRSLLYTSDRHGDPEVYRHDIVSRTETRVTDSPGVKHSPTYSPDGKWIAYAAGDDQIRLIETASGDDRAFIRANFSRSTMFAWSPDSRWLVFTAQDERAFVNLHVQRVGETMPHQISFLSNVSTFFPLWSPDGQFIISSTRQYRDEAHVIRVDLRPRPPLFREEEFEKLFAEAKDDGRKPKDEAVKPKGELETTREHGHMGEMAAGEEPIEANQGTISGSQPPIGKHVEIVFEGIDRRLKSLTLPQMDAVALAISPDGRDLIFHAVVAGKGNLWTMPLDEPRADHPPRQLTATNGSKSAAQFAPDGKSFFYLDGGQVIIRKFPNGEASQLPINAEVVVDFHQEKLQVFDESWRILRDRFYDPTFRGLDWSAVRTAFGPYVAGAQSAGDLRAILNLMIGELRASHTGASGRGEPIEDGYLGLIFDVPEQAASGRLRIAEVLPDSPAALAGIAVGEELLAVDGTALGPYVSLDTLLQRTVARRVKLRLGAANGTARDVAVRPVSAYTYDGLRYRAWTYANEAYVHRVSGGRLGYAHIREMSYAAYQRFLSDLDAETHSKEGVVIDVRFNSGGYIFSFILDVLTRRTVVLHGFRDFPSADSAHIHGNRVLNKPTVLVINERSFSNTEMFAEGYRRLGLGTIVGRPSGGAVIGTTVRQLLDGTQLRVPQYRVATPDGEELEGHGRAVDIDVALPLGAAARGRDTQLDAAVAALLAQIDRQP